jgi:hypothetical protein
MFLTHAKQVLQVIVKVKSIIYGLNNYASLTQGCDVTNILDQATDVKQRTVETYE